MNNKRKGLALVAGLVIVSLLQAQDTKQLSLNDAIQLSLQNSKQLKNSQAKIEEATAALTEAVQNRLPNASVSGSYMRLSTANINLKTQKPSNGSGGSSQGGGAPNISQAMYGIFNASLPIYTGGRIRYGIESSRYLQQAAMLDAENDKEDVIQNTIDAYANLYKAKSAVGLVKESLAQSQQRVKDFSNMEQNGLLARNDLLKAELQESNTELALLDAENNWKLANVNMNLMLGLPEQTEIVTDSTGMEQLSKINTVDEYVQGALNSRKDEASLALKKKAAESGVMVARSGYYPSLQLTGGYIAADIPGFLTLTNALNAGVGVSYNFGSLWKTKAKVQQAESRAKQLSINQSILDDRIRLQVNQAYLNLLSTQKKIDVYSKAVEQANENYRITKNKYNNSLATTTDLLDADVAQLQARMNYVFAKADAVVAYYKLLQVSGQLEQSIGK
jgi:outer membrane protein TolC